MNHSVQPKGGYPERKAKLAKTKCRKKAQKEKKKERKKKGRDIIIGTSNHTENHQSHPWTLFSLLPTTKQPPHHPTSTLASIHNTTTHRLPSLSDGVDNRARRPTHIVALLIFTLTLGAVDAFLGKGVADRCEHAILTNLAGDETVYAILEGVDLLDACYFGLVERVCNNRRRVPSVNRGFCACM